MEHTRWLPRLSSLAWPEHKILSPQKLVAIEISSHIFLPLELLLFLNYIASSLLFIHYSADTYCVPIVCQLLSQRLWINWWEWVNSEYTLDYIPGWERKKNIKLINTYNIRYSLWERIIFFFHGTLSTKTLRIDCDWYVQKTNLKDSGIEGKQIKGTMVEAMEVGKGYP